MPASHAYVLAVFCVVYLGMILGGLPRLHLDRTGVALLGAIAIVAAGVLTPEQAAEAIHLPTILLLFSFMVISAQMRLGGFYTRVTRGIAALALGPAAQGLHLGEPLPLFAGTLALSNLVSNVPAVMLLLPVAGGTPSGGLTLALVSTLAGNLLIVGSIANIIVVDAARKLGIEIDWRRHARTGVPVTIVTLAITAGWLAWRHAG